MRNCIEHETPCSSRTKQTRRLTNLDKMDFPCEILMPRRTSIWLNFLSLGIRIYLVRTDDQRRLAKKTFN